MNPPRFSPRLSLLLALVVLQTAALAALQPALNDYAARIRTFHAQVPAVARSAQQAAEAMLAHPEALLNVPDYEQMGFNQELMNRSGGLAHVYPSDGWGRTPTKFDVVLLSVRAWETQSGLIRRRIREYHRQGWTVTIIGSKAGRPGDLGADFFIDNGAPSGAAGHGRINALANITLGWMWCCEYAAAMSRKGKFPAVLQSICITGGEEYDRTVQSPEGRHAVVDCPQAIAAGELSKRYLLRVETMIQDLKSEHVQGQLSRAAGVIADRLAKGGRVGMVGMGHIILEEVKVENRTPWLGFRAVGNSNVAIKAYLRPGDLLVWMSYNGLSSKYEDYAKSIADAKVDLISCYAPDPEWSKNPPPTLAHIDQGWKLPDAEVPIPVFPNFMAPVSGIDVTLLLRMLDDETAARLRTVKTPPQAPVVLPPDFCQRIADQIYERGNDGASRAVRRWGFVDASGKVIPGRRYDEVGAMASGLAPVKRGGKWGYVDAKGAEVIAPAYETADPFYHDGTVAKVGAGGKFGLIDTSGRALLPPRYDDINPVYWWRPASDFVFVKTGGKWGMVDKTGKELIPPRYDEMDMFTQDKATFKSGRKFGVVAKTGDEVIPPTYDRLWGCWEGPCAPMCRDGKWGWLDADGKEIMPPTYEDFIFSRGDTMLIKQHGMWGAVNRTGAEIAAPKYAQLTGYEEESGLLTGKTSDGKFGAINMKAGREIPPLYDEMLNPSESTIAVRRDGKWGYVDAEGKELLPAVYEEALPFQNGSAAVQRDGKRLFIDRKGMDMAVRGYDFFTPGGDGFTKVVRDGKWGLIDAAGKEIVAPTYTFICSFSNKTALVYAGGAWQTPVGRTPVLLGGRWGLIDRTGREIVPPKYDRIIPLGDALFAAGTNVDVTMPQP